MDIETLKGELAAAKAELAKLSPIAAKAPELEATINDLKSQLTAAQAEKQTLAQEKENTLLKTQFPDLDLTLIPAGTFDEKKAFAEKLVAWKGGNVNPDAGKTGAGAWNGVGSISAHTKEVTDAAKLEAEKKQKEEAVKNGDSKSVADLVVKSLLSRIGKAPATAK